MGAYYLHTERKEIDMNIPQEISDYYFTMHPDRNVAAYIDVDYTTSIDMFFSNFDAIVRKHFPNFTTNKIDQLIDELYEQL